MALRTNTETVKKERFRLLRQIGRRVRWLREAWERQEEGLHSQAQWAAALSVTAEMMSRIENGRQLAPVDVLVKIITFSGASADYVLLGVVNEQAMRQWLYESLMARHGGDLMTFERYQENLQQKFGTTPSRHAPRSSGLLRHQYRIQRKAD